MPQSKKKCIIVEKIDLSNIKCCLLQTFHVNSNALKIYFHFQLSGRTNLVNDISAVAERERDRDTGKKTEIGSRRVEQRAKYLCLDSNNSGNKLNNVFFCFCFITPLISLRARVLLKIDLEQQLIQVL